MASSDFRTRVKYCFSTCSADLPCSLSTPVYGSCCLYNGVRTASNQVTAVLVPASFAKGGFAPQLSDFVTSSAVHLRSSPKHLPALLQELFSVRSPPLSYKNSSAEWFDNPACTALPEGQRLLSSFSIVERTCMAQTKMKEKASLCLLCRYNLVFLCGYFLFPQH